MSASWVLANQLALWLWAFWLMALPITLWLFTDGFTFWFWSLIFIILYSLFFFVIYLTMSNTVRCFAYAHTFRTVYTLIEILIIIRIIICLGTQRRLCLGNKFDNQVFHTLRHKLHFLVLGRKNDKLVVRRQVSKLRHIFNKK